MRIVVKEPGRAPEVREIEKSLDAMQQVVAHGDFRMLEVVQDGPPGLDLWANEEGKYAAKTVTIQTPDGPQQVTIFCEANLSIFGGQDYVMGTVFVAASTSDSDGRSLEDMEVEIAKSWLSQHAVGIIAAARARALAEAYR